MESLITLLIKKNPFTVELICTDSAYALAFLITSSFFMILSNLDFSLCKHSKTIATELYFSVVNKSIKIGKLYDSFINYFNYYSFKTEGIHLKPSAVL